MKIRVLDQANLSGAKIQKMERYVEAALAAIEIDVKWTDCDTEVEACKPGRGPNEFWLRILPKIPQDSGADQLGFTQPDGIQCVNVIYPMIERLVRDLNVDAGQLLGAAVVHEIGHLYLGENDKAHSLNGIMCGNWSRREVEAANTGSLKFIGDQGSRIRAAMNAWSVERR